MQPFMTKEMHRRFEDLHDVLVQADGDAAHVFVPVAPPVSSPLRLLFVGQATKGWSEENLENYDAAWNRAAEIVASPSSRSGFWQAVRRIVTGVAIQVGRPDLSGKLRDVIGWSNLVKVGHPDRNPGPASWKAQAELCVEQLRREMTAMRPSVIVVMTRDFASKEILLPVFGDSGWTNDVPQEDRVAWKLAPLPVIWMNHPRNMGQAGYRDASIETAVDVVSAHMSIGVDHDDPS